MIRIRLTKRVLNKILIKKISLVIDKQINQKLLMKILIIT